MPHTIKQEKPFSEKLKQFFRVGKGDRFARPQEAELVLGSELVEELGREQTILTRLRVLKELQPQVKEQRLQTHGVELIWYKIQDLLDQGQDISTRHQVLEFLCDLVVGQYGTALDMMRPQLFRFITEHQVVEDLEQRVNLMAALTDTGKDIVHIEEKMGPFILVLLDVPLDKETTSPRMQLMSLTSNMIRYNSAYLDQNVVVVLIHKLSVLACNSTMDPEIIGCLDCFKCIVMYSYVPPEALVSFISCVCRVVNLSSLSGEAWDLMRKLMGTHLGHSALYNLRQIVSSPLNLTDTALIRGAVFFIGQALWGPQRISSLRYSAMSVLPVFISALECPHQLVMFEVAVQVEKLVTSQGDSLTAPSWEEAVSVLEMLVSRLDRCTEGTTMRGTIHSHLQSTIAQLEVLALTDSYAGSRTRLYGLVESVSELCPEASVLHLLTFLQETHIHPARADWMTRLSGVMERFYVKETRRIVRMKTLKVLCDVVTSNLRLHEEPLLENCVLPYLIGGLDTELDRVVRVEAVHTVALLASKAVTSHLGDLVDILEKICNKFGEGPNNDTAVLYTRDDFDYQLAAVLGLIKCFRVKFFSQGLMARRIYYILVNVVDQIYDRPAVSEHTGEVRLEIFRTLLSIRANFDYHLGFPRDGGIGYSFSPCLVCERQDEEEGETVTVLSLTRACMCLIRSLKEETDWSVLSLVLKQIPDSLQNKGMLTRYGKDISRFATVLCSMFSPGHPLPSLNTPAKFGRPEFQSSVYPVLAALASYNRSLDQALQKKLIKCFEYGLLTSKCNQVCIVALTALILEMSGSMYTLLPEVLLNLSKISATVHIAIPMLEFLSTLISLPKIFSSFNSEQFLSVFAITLPYTNPFKFNHYTVSLAHHVIISWFLKCRLSTRNDFVKFIIKGLGSNVLQPFEEGNFRKEVSLSSLNQDSSSRTRSSSLKEESGGGRRQRHMTGVPSRSTLNRLSGPDERQALLTFHQELTETCVDLMARYSFSNCGVQPRRSPLVEFLLSQGHSCSWLVGNVIVTITVSGCAQDINKGGFCDACWTSCRSESTEDEGLSQESPKKRHVSEQNARVRRGPGTLTEGDQEPFKPLTQGVSMRGPGISTVGGQEGLSLIQEGYRRGSGTLADGLKDVEPSFKGGNSVKGSETSSNPKQCGCWCSGWCEVLIRRPSGVTGWVCRVENGLLSNQPPGEANCNLQDIADLLKPSSTSVDESCRSKEVKKTPRMELDLAASCQPIAEIPDEEEMPRARANTISTTPVKGRGKVPPLHPQQDRLGGAAMSPQFMFLQLYQAAGLPTSYNEKPLLLPQTKSIESSLKNLDRIFCYETHKVGVLYVGQGQEGDERSILSNQFGSSRYAAFIAGLGTLVDIGTIDEKTVYMGGLDPRNDGQFAYIWQDDLMQVVYHVATLMPNKEKDPQFNKKKMHIGNNYVAIVYNESGQPYTMGTVKGQFIYAVILVEPLDFESNRMSVICKSELGGELGHLATPRIVSDHNLARLTRQTALHCNLAAVIFSQSQRSKDPYASNWLERLRHIKRFKGKVLKDQEDDESSGLLHDFTGYV